MAEDKKVITPHELAAQGDPDAQEYLRWVKLKRRKEELLNKLSTTAGVDQKFRDPEFTKAQADYYGSPSDLARRALESTAMAGNVLKAAIKTPEGASESRIGQVVRAIKATTGLPEDAFRENRIEGSDFTDNETLASAIDIGADLVGGAAAAAGTKALAKKAGSAIASKIPHTIGDIKNIPSVARSADDLAEQAAMFKKIDEQQVFKKAFDKANPIIPEAPTASVVDSTSTRTGLDSLDIPEITPTVRINQELVDDVIPLPGGKPALALTGRVSTPLTQAERAAREEAEAAFTKGTQSGDWSDFFNSIKGYTTEVEFGKLPIWKIQGALDQTNPFYERNIGALKQWNIEKFSDGLNLMQTRFNDIQALRAPQDFTVPTIYLVEKRTQEQLYNYLLQYKAFL